MRVDRHVGAADLHAQRFQSEALDIADDANRDDGDVSLQGLGLAARFPFRVNGKAIAAGATEGFVKTVFDAKTGALLGAHMIGHEVTEMIQGYVLAITLEATEAELMATVFPHPTMSEAMHEAVLDAWGRALHI